MHLARFRTQALLLATSVLLVASAGCKKPRKKPVLTKDQVRRIQSSLLQETPKPKIAIGADFGGKVQLIGLDIEPTEVKAGGRVKVTWYWKSIGAVEGPWKIFVHLEAPGKRRRPFDHHAVEGLYPVEDWKVGDLVVDRQIFDIEANFPAGEAVLYVGIFDEEMWTKQRKDRRLPLVSNGHGKNAGSDRLEVARFQILDPKGAKTSRKRPGAVRYRVSKVAQAPALDGKLDDPVWATASWTPFFRQPDRRPLNPALRTRAKLLYDGEALYLAFETLDSDIMSKLEGRDAKLWEADVVEAYLDPGKDARDYLEFQFAPTGVVFDGHFSSHRNPEWPVAAKRFDLAGLEAKVFVDGTLNKPGDKDEMWSVEAKIPFSGLPGVEGAPAVGSVWGFNLYRIDNAGPRSIVHMGALAPVGGDFHNLDGAALLVFGPSVAVPAPKAPGGTR